jgi:hypothetical protein
MKKHPLLAYFTLLILFSASVIWGMHLLGPKAMYLAQA